MPEFRYERTFTGPFDLEFQNQYFNGWPTTGGDTYTIVMAFPVEGTDASVAVSITQVAHDRVTGDVYGSESNALADKAWGQALASLSLDADGSGWPAVGQRDQVVGKLQSTYRHMRPSLFHSPYEAAAGFVIGHRLSIAQGRALRVRIAQRYGSDITFKDGTYYAFPTPAQLLATRDIAGLSPTKSARLMAVAEVALAGGLDRQYLRSLPEAEALKELTTIPGIGPFFAQGILHRGAGTVDGLTLDDMTLAAISASYHELGGTPTRSTAQELAEAWHPYRMWATVLLHVWMRQNNLVPQRGSRR